MKRCSVLERSNWQPAATTNVKLQAMDFLVVVLPVLAIPAALCWYAFGAPRSPAIVTAALGLAGWALLVTWASWPDP
jgi:hypothetical protein